MARLQPSAGIGLWSDCRLLSHCLLVCYLLDCRRSSGATKLPVLWAKWQVEAGVASGEPGQSTVAYQNSRYLEFSRTVPIRTVR